MESMSALVFVMFSLYAFSHFLRRFICFVVLCFKSVSDTQYKFYSIFYHPDRSISSWVGFLNRILS